MVKRPTRNETKEEIDNLIVKLMYYIRSGRTKIFNTVERLRDFAPQLKNQRRETSGENPTETLEGIVKIINKVTEKQKSARRTTERPSLNLRRVKCETRRKKL